MRHPLLGDNRSRVLSSTHLDIDSNSSSSSNDPALLTLTTSFDNQLSISAPNSFGSFRSGSLSPGSDSRISQRICTDCRKRWTSTRLCSSCMLNIPYIDATSFGTESIPSHIPPPGRCDFSIAQGCFQQDARWTSFMVFTPYGRIARVTKPILGKLGATQSQMEGQRITKLLALEDRHKFEEILQKLFSKLSDRPEAFPIPLVKLECYETDELTEPIPEIQPISAEVRVKNLMNHNFFACRLTLWLGSCFGATMGDASTHSKALIIGSLQYTQHIQDSQAANESGNRGLFRTKSSLPWYQNSNGSSLLWPTRGLYPSYSPINSPSPSPITSPTSDSGARFPRNSFSHSRSAALSPSSGSSSSLSSTSPATQRQYGVPRTRTNSISGHVGYEEQFRMASYFSPMAMSAKQVK